MDTKKPTILLLLSKLREQRKDKQKKIPALNGQVGVISPVWECPSCRAGKMVFLMGYQKSFITQAFLVKMAWWPLIDVVFVVFFCLTMGLD